MSKSKDKSSKKDKGQAEPSEDIEQAEEAAAAENSGANAEEVDPLKKLEEEKEFFLQQLQLSRAELENYRRRTTAERFEQQKRVSKNLFLEMLPLYDDLLLALEAKDSSEGSLQKGLQIIVDKFTTFLSDHKVSPIDAIGEVFDPVWHEAMFHEEREGAKAGEVLEIFERGYRFEEELLRPARVKVAKSSD